MHAERSSATALIIAASLRLQHLDGMPAQCVAPEAARVAESALRTAGGGWGMLDTALRLGPFRAALKLVESIMLPGIQAHYAARKWQIERWTRAAIARNCTQLVVLGAGMDALAWRLARENPALRCVEIDHPATQALKRRALDALGAPPANLSFVAADLTDRYSHRWIDGAALDPERDSVVVAEGLLMYLAWPRVLRLFAGLRRAHRGRSDLLFSLMQADPDGRPRFRHASRWVDAWLRRRAEPFRWGCEPSLLSERCAGLGLVVRAQWDGTTAPFAHWPRWRPCIGEHLVHAQA